MHNFDLHFALANPGQDPTDFALDLLTGACHDSILTLSDIGKLSLTFKRDGSTETEAVRSAIQDAHATIPGMTLIGVSTDSISLRDLDAIERQFGPL